MYIHQSYPKWKYHSHKEACIVASAEQEEALGQGWHESPVSLEAESAPAQKSEETVLAGKKRKPSGGGKV